MKTNIKATGIVLTPAISNYVDKKISSIEKYLDKKNSPDVIAQVEVGMSTRHHKAGNIFRAEVHITGVGLDLYAVSEMEDLYAAIDVVKDEIVQNVLQLKGKRETLTRRGAKMMKSVMKGLNFFKKKG
ncbi:MAG: ribosome-associated translation inhibitor RaiA [bacterium]|nr:ribosome-associated translation inhibitor RaiA [bacterium]